MRHSLLLLALSTASAAAQDAPLPMVVSTRWLADHLTEPGLVVFHVGDDRSKATYDAGHIPGAQFLNPWTEISAPRQEGGLSLEMPTAEQLKSALEAKGVGERSRIVLYQSNQYFSPVARAYLTLEYAGLQDRVAILDGGLERWTAEGHPVNTDGPTVAPGRFTPRLRSELVVDADYVHRSLDNPSIAVVDSRDPRFYQGAETRQGRNGHIPGATNIPFSSIVTEGGLFKDPETLKSMFVEAGAAPGDRVVTYCHIGQQASLVWFGARLAGYDAVLFDGSFQLWARRTDLPVDPGTQPPPEQER